VQKPLDGISPEDLAQQGGGNGTAETASVREEVWINMLFGGRERINLRNITDKTATALHAANFPVK